jgi:hypothetical protein
MIKRDFGLCRMDALEGACARVDYGGAHRVTMADQILCGIEWDDK